MPTCKLSPVFNDEQLSNAGLPLSGGQLFWYLAGTTTPATTYTDSLGITPQANPIILNVRGEPTNPIWLPSGSTYKAVLEDSLGNILRSIDNISGINDTATTEWLLYSGVATYIGATSFSVVGDQTSVFTVNRRIKAAVSGGTVYASIATSVFSAGITTLTTTNDSTALDSGLASMYYGFLDPLHPSIGIKNLNFIALTSSGNFTTPANITTSTVFEITLVGGGAGGGGSNGVNSTAYGGGAGGAVRFIISGLAPSTAYAVVIGNGGAGGSATPTDGAVGGTTQITINGTVYSCTGGAIGNKSITQQNSRCNIQGVASASILALPHESIFQTATQVGCYAGTTYIGSHGAALPFGSNGQGSDSSQVASAGTGYGVGGGAGVGAGGGVGGTGGAGAPGLFEARWVA